MPRPAKPWWYAARGKWYAWIGGVKCCLGADYQAAIQEFRRLKADEPKHVRTESELGLLFDRFLDHHHQHSVVRTYNWYREALKPFAAHVGLGLDAYDLRPIHVLDWADLHYEWSSSTRHGRIRAIQTALRWAHRQGMLDRNPIQFIEKPTPKAREVAFTAEQIQACIGATPDPEFCDYLIAMRQTGARPEEMRRIERQYCDLDRGLWILPTSKAKGHRRPKAIVLTATAWAITRKLCDQWPDGPIFRNTRGKPWSRNAVRCRFMRLREKLGLVGLCATTFGRHTFATRGLMAGVDSSTMQALLGHADASMLSRHYAHLGANIEYLRAAAEQAAS